MVKFLLKKSYSRKDLKEKDFKDLWNAHGVFTTMWIYGKPQKILFFKEHITNLIKSTKNYKIYDRNLKRNIFKIIKSNLNKQKNYNHLLRIAVTKSLISISLRDKLKIKKNLQLKLVNYNRIKPEHKNLKYKFILKNLSKMDNTKSDIGFAISEGFREPIDLISKKQEGVSSSKYIWQLSSILAITNLLDLLVKDEIRIEISSSNLPLSFTFAEVETLI